ncbi:hypothetical protein TNCV_897521 [Trichonephila clavipes]|nr:hypothetical protein TNCV_897521 [Trichonephila clavipes]
MSNKRENKNKEFPEEFIFLKKPDRPDSPIKPQEPLETSNNFSDLEQDVEQPLVDNSQETVKEVISKSRPPPKILLKIKSNYTEKIKFLYEKFPNIRNKCLGDFIKIYSIDVKEYRSHTRLLA